MYEAWIPTNSVQPNYYLEAPNPIKSLYNPPADTFNGALSSKVGSFTASCTWIPAN